MDIGKNMREKIHRIVDLCMDLENGVTHASCDISAHVKWVYVQVWEGAKLDDTTLLYREFAVYDGYNFNEKEEQKINDIIRALEDFLKEQNSWKG